jgi:hypothetical protein
MNNCNYCCYCARVFREEEPNSDTEVKGRPAGFLRETHPSQCGSQSRERAWAAQPQWGVPLCPVTEYWGWVSSLTQAWISMEMMQWACELISYFLKRCADPHSWLSCSFSFLKGPYAWLSKVPWDKAVTPCSLAFLSFSCCYHHCCLFSTVDIS